MNSLKYYICCSFVILSSCIPTATPTHQKPPPISPVGNQGSQSSFVQSSQASNYVGEHVSVRINRAYCAYFPSTSGKPTFCNDKPYPNNNFTMVVWEKDWSHYDGACIVVYGLVSIYKGKPEIKVESPSQVSQCN